MTIEKLAIELLGLPAKSRAVLAQKLLASLEDEVDAADLDAMWAELAEQRLIEVEEGKVEARSADAVLRDVRARIEQ